MKLNCVYGVSVSFLCLLHQLLFLSLPPLYGPKSACYRGTVDSISSDIICKATDQITDT